MSPKNAAGREAICRQVVALVESCGFKAEVTAQWPAKPSRDAMVHITAGPVRAGLIVGLDEVDGTYVLPWYISGSSATLTGAFSAAAGHTINPHHRRKCTAVYPSLTRMMERLERTLRCIADGTGLEEKSK